MPEAFSADALWAKSKVMVERALRARDSADPGEFAIWSSIAVELLGKSVLARVHPVLVADPESFANVLSAFGLRDHPDKKSIQAKTLFDRLHMLDPTAFNADTKRDCSRLATLRNAELHSGETPASDADERSWVPGFWRAAKVLVQMSGRTLEDWVGADETVRAVEIIANASNLRRLTVEARIARRRREFFVRFSAHSADHVAAQEVSRRQPPPRVVSHGADAVAPEQCPACECTGWISGNEIDSEVVRRQSDEMRGGAWDEEFPEFPLYETVRVTYETLSFQCFECGLQLDGEDELTFGDVSTSFDEEHEREEDFSEDYGNE